jgi:hypothetical protein
MYKQARLVLLAALAAPLAACDVQVGEQGVSVEMVEGKATDEWTRTYTIAAGGQLDIVNDHGTIDVFPATGPQVEVRAAREVKSRTDDGARELLEQITIEETIAPDRVSIVTSQPRGGGFRERLTVAYRVNVPAGLVVSIRSEHGGLRLENVDGRFTALSTNGMVTGRGVSGAIDATSVNGGIMMELGTLRGDSRLTTVNGGIHLDVQPGVNATLEASGVNQGIMIGEGFPLETTERERRRVAGRINQGGPKIVLQTTNGGIVIGAGREDRRPREIGQELRTR